MHVTMCKMGPIKFRPHSMSDCIISVLMQAKICHQDFNMLLSVYGGLSIDTGCRFHWWCLFFCMPHLVWRWRALECTAAGAAVGPDGGLRGVLSSWCCTEGAWEGCGSLQVWGGRAHQQPHREDTMDTILANFCHILFVCILNKICCL